MLKVLFSLIVDLNVLPWPKFRGSRPFQTGLDTKTNLDYCSVRPNGRSPGPHWATAATTATRHPDCGGRCVGLQEPHTIQFRGRTPAELCRSLKMTAATGWKIITAAGNRDQSFIYTTRASSSDVVNVRETQPFRLSLSQDWWGRE